MPTIHRSLRKLANCGDHHDMAPSLASTSSWGLLASRQAPVRGTDGLPAGLESYKFELTSCSLISFFVYMKQLPRRIVHQQTRSLNIINGVSNWTHSYNTVTKVPWNPITQIGIVLGRKNCLRKQNILACQMAPAINSCTGPLECLGLK